ncbi:suppressor of fused domain protein [Kaistia terrae]|uniref:Suppressor of fused domain protein n=1 Tax=Kaistia terrae TaxID=537017 RepID=A0ABW0PZD6_9HYPH|nr:suppressor of fused domain protein [Kaistia terrae]MCX5577238.1 suppressor of fused domain protein [Kaistia terrae]
MRTPSLFERSLGKTIRAAFGVETKVFRFGDDDGVVDCAIVSGRNFPVEGVTSYGSVGLSQTVQQAGDVEVKVEVVTACASDTPHVDSLLSSCVFDCFKNRTNISYGSLIPDIIDQYGISRTLRHVTFVAPFLWPALDKIEVEGQVIYCLLMVPISDGEKAYLESNGIDALEALFDNAQIDIFDINRASVVS